MSLGDRPAGAGERLAAFQASLRGGGFPGTVGLRVCTLAGEDLVAWNAERVFPAASTIKVPLLIMALQAAQAGRLDLRGQVVVGAADRVPGTGVLHELLPGVTLAWQDVLTLMIIVSDNTATNLLIGRLGVEAVNTWLAAQGLRSSRLVGKLQLPAEQRSEAQRRGERNATTARDQTDLLLALMRGELLDGAHTALALDILERQHHRDLIGRRVPCGADGERLYRSATKSGELLGVRHDVGVLFTPRALVVALLSEGGRDPREHPENEDVRVLADALWTLLSDLGGLGARGDI
ncbi:class A beta-lactamase-related serine hydrolase [Deinococcus taeanensis]|uniref:serine hydrolase n=1 Tax=Deinococcus taeanensis TaxID=2737050 RepID=UPI001CDD8EB6|nr:serine hydrolase [Deinococcus taeanensis]UBV42794.1 class A beta-lactamase-related serine hydrolase [Deinococcus taeanensis]